MTVVAQHQGAVSARRVTSGRAWRAAAAHLEAALEEMRLAEASLERQLCDLRAHRERHGLARPALPAKL